MRSLPLGPLLLGLLGGAVAPLEAQWSVGTGAMAVEYSGVSRLSGVQVGPAFRLTRTALFAELGGSGTWFDDGTWSGDAGGVLAWRPTMIGGFEPELIGSAGFAGAQGSDLTSSVGLHLRVHRPIGGVALFVGGGGGRSDDGFGSRSYSAAEIGGTLRAGRIETTLAIAPSRSAGARYTDIALELRREGRITLEATGGFRPASAFSPNDETWFGGSAEMNLSGAWNLFASAGGFPSDVAQGSPGGTFLTFGVRLGANDRSPLRPLRGPVATRPLPWPEATFEVRAKGRGIQELIVAAPTASSVEVTGDFTDWEPLALVRDGRLWKVRLLLPAGLHRINLRIDGGAWQVPPGLSATADEFGGATGLLAVD